MTAKILVFARPVNGVIIDQRRSDGFINATAMCIAHGKEVKQWFRNEDSIEYIQALASDLGIQLKGEISHLSNTTSVSRAYPELVIAKLGSPDNGGGTWVYPDIAIKIAYWCNKPFEIQVIRWIKEWLLTGRNPIQVDTELEIANHEKRYGKRIKLKDEHRVALMNVVSEWAQNHRVNPLKLCSGVHDVINKRIQGYESQQIREMGSLPIASLIRDYFGADILDVYGQINKIARNLIVDSDLDPIQATNKACDIYLSKSYVPALTPILENLYEQGYRLRAKKQAKVNLKPTQLTLFDIQQAS